MRILLDTSSLMVGGGIQVGLGIIAQASLTTEHEWHVVLSAPMGAELSESALASFGSVQRLPPVKSKLATRLKECFSILPRLENRIRPDVVFTVFGPSLWRARAPHLEGFAFGTLLYPESAHLAHLPWHQRCKAHCLDWLAATRIRKNKHWVVETETVRQRMGAVLGIPLDRIMVVRNSYSPLFAHYFAQGERCPPPADCLRILVPSAFYPHKNLEMIPAVAAHLRQLIKEPFRFVFTLPEKEGGWQTLKRMACEQGVSDHVTTVGRLSHHNIADAYQQSHVVFLPTVLECSTAVYPESFLAERPVVTSRMDFAREACGDAALYFDPSSPVSAAAALASVMGDDHLRARLLANGRAALRTNFPTPRDKWHGYLECLRVVAAHG